MCSHERIFLRLQMTIPQANTTLVLGLLVLGLVCMAAIQVRIGTCSVNIGTMHNIYTPCINRPIPRRAS